MIQPCSRERVVVEGKGSPILGTTFGLCHLDVPDERSETGIRPGAYLGTLILTASQHELFAHASRIRPATAEDEELLKHDPTPRLAGLQAFLDDPSCLPMLMGETTVKVQ